MKQPTISVITPTLNNERDIEGFIQSIKKQTYPAGKVEIILADGGSKDETLTIAKKYNVKTFNNVKVFADIGVNEGIKLAKGDLIMILASDNIFKSEKAFAMIAKVFEDANIFAAFPKHATSSKDSLFSNYINTFTDPVNHFVYGYASNPRTFNKVYKIIKKNNDYCIYDYKSNPTIPMIAFAQGFTFRAGFTRSSQNAFDDTTPVMELVNNNKKIAFLNSVDLYHHTIHGLRHFIDKQAWKTRNYLDNRNFGIAHRKELLSAQQLLRLKIWPLYSLSIVPPFLYAFYHLAKDREKMWIFHPFLCIISGYTSFFTYLKVSFNKILK